MSLAVRVSVVGTAGRGVDGKKLTKEVYHRAIDKAKEVIIKRFKLSLENVHLVSGGAAWADHIAVALFLQQEVSDLTLHFPAKFLLEAEKPQFNDTGVKNWEENPGRSANRYHHIFSKKINDDSLVQIQTAISIGASYKEHSGFHERNSYVASSDYLIAFTWSDGDAPVKGGTFDTWKKCKGRKVHVSLNSLVGELVEKRTDISSYLGKRSSHDCDSTVLSTKRALTVSLSPITLVSESSKTSQASYRSRCQGTKGSKKKLIKTCSSPHTQHMVQAKLVAVNVFFHEEL